MRKSLTAIFVALVVAVLAASVVVAAFESIASMPNDVAALLSGFTPTLLSVAQFSLFPSLVAIGISETWRVRGLPFWLLVGLVIGLAGFGWRSMAGSVGVHALGGISGFAALAMAGVVGGWLYWWLAGRNAGRLAGALHSTAEAKHVDRRCAGCTAVSLLIGIVPLATLGSATIGFPQTAFVAALAGQAESDAQTRLSDAGLDSIVFKIDGGVGVLSGSAPANVSPATAFARAQEALSPMVGMPGIVARLENRIAKSEINAQKP